MATASPYFPHTKWLALTGADPRGMKLRTGAGTVDVPDDPGAGAMGLRFACAGSNPFRERAVFSYALPGAGVAGDLSIVDAAGRRVRAIAIAPDAEAAGSLVWDGRMDSGDAAPAGVYFAKLKAGAASRVLRLIRLP